MGDRTSAKDTSITQAVNIIPYVKEPAMVLLYKGKPCSVTATIMSVLWKNPAEAGNSRPYQDPGFCMCMDWQLAFASMQEFSRHLQVDCT